MHPTSGLVGPHCGDPADLSVPRSLPSSTQLMESWTSASGTVYQPSRKFFLHYVPGDGGGGDMMLQVLERSIPISTSSCSSLSHPPGMFSASKQREVHPEGPADGAHAAGAQVSPPSPGAQVGAPRQGRGLSTPPPPSSGRSCLPGAGLQGPLGGGRKLSGQACLEGPQEERAGPGDVCLCGPCRSWSNTRRMRWRRRT